MEGSLAFESERERLMAVYSKNLHEANKSNRLLKEEKRIYEGEISPGHLCSREKHRQFAHLSLEKMIPVLNSREDKLPVVEIKPFTQQEWRPARSVPNRFHNRSYTSVQLISAKKHHTDNTPNSPKELAPPQDYTESPCPRVLYEAADRMTSHPRLKDGVVVDQSTTQAFVPKVGREKSTLEDIRCGKQHPRTAGTISSGYQVRRSPRYHEQIQVFGRGLYQFSDPSDDKKLSVSISADAKTNNSAEKLISQMQMRIENIENTYMDGNIYDTFDRSNTLPSISVKQANLRNRRYNKQTSTGNGGSANTRSTTPRQSARSCASPAHRLGVTNTISFLRNVGKPSGLEQQLSLQLNNTINQLRRSKDVSSVTGNYAKYVFRYKGPNAGASGNPRKRLSEAKPEAQKVAQAQRRSVSELAGVNGQSDSGIESPSGDQSQNENIVSHATNDRVARETVSDTDRLINNIYITERDPFPNKTNDNDVDVKLKKFELKSTKVLKEQLKTKCNDVPKIIPTKCDDTQVISNRGMEFSSTNDPMENFTETTEDVAIASRSSSKQTKVIRLPNESSDINAEDESNGDSIDNVSYPLHTANGDLDEDFHTIDDDMTNALIAF